MRAGGDRRGDDDRQRICRRARPRGSGISGVEHPRRHQRNSSKYTYRDDVFKGTRTGVRDAGSFFASFRRPERDADHGNDIRWSRGIHRGLGNRRPVGSRQLPHQSSRSGALLAPRTLLDRARLRAPGGFAFPPLARGKTYRAQLRIGQWRNKKRVRLSTHPLSCSGNNPDQVQTITPVVLSQVLADCECTAVALQLCGGPAANVAVMVTFCEGVKPCRGEAIVAVPAKYAPLLSAAY